MLPQTPPDAPAPPPSAEALRSRRYWRAIWMSGVISIAVILAVGLSAPLFIRKRTGCGQSEAVNNARQIGIALFEFETEYGKFPDASTIDAVRANTGTKLLLGTKSSNDYFRQLIGSGIAQSETMFYAKCAGSKKPDGDFLGNQALAKGEVGFAYLSGLGAEGSPSRPIVLTPLIPGTDRFDPKPFDGKAVVLKMDNSLTSMPIGKDGHVRMNGINLLDRANPVWAGEKWTLVWPE